MKTPTIDQTIGSLSLPLLMWGVKEDEALITTIIWMEVATQRGKWKWTDIESAPIADPEGIVKMAIAVDAHSQFPKKLKKKLTYSAEITEQAIFAVYQNDIIGLAEAVQGCHAVHARFMADPAAFWKRLAEYTGRKCAGIQWEQNQHQWVRSAVKYWIVSPAWPKCKNSPPMCLWADSAFKVFFDGVPNLGNSIRKTLENIGLYRPEGIAFRICGNEWELCSRIHRRGVTKPLNVVPAS